MLERIERSLTKLRRARFTGCNARSEQRLYKAASIIWHCILREMRLNGRDLYDLLL